MSEMTLPAQKSPSAEAEALAAGRTTRLLLTRRHPWIVLLVGSVFQVGLLYGVGVLGDTYHYLGIPGAAAALFGVLAAVMAGPLVGGVVALVGGAAFVAFVTDFGQSVGAVAIAIAILLWTLAAVIAGTAGRSIRRRAWEREGLLSKALDESESSKTAMEGILTLGLNFQRAQSYEAMVDAICAAARETFAAGSASLYASSNDRLVLLARDPSNPLLPTGQQLAPGLFPPVTQVLESGTPEFVADVSAESWPAHSREIVRSLGIRSLLRIPMRITPTSAYLLVIGWDQVQESLDPARLVLAQRFADQTAAALEHAEAETLHRRLERSLLSHTRDRHPRLDLHVYYRSGESRLGIGGDFVDYVVHGDSGLSFVIGDVSGHGPDAAALGATLRSGWRALADVGAPPRVMVQCLDRMLVAERSDARMFCTLLAGQLDLSIGSLTLANAGHPPPLMVAEKASLLPVRPVLPLGCQNHNGWQAGSFDLPETWSLLLYTDGLFEGFVEPGSRERYGLDRLVERFDRAAPGPLPVSQLDEVLAELERANGKPPPDDVAVLLISKAA
ncbi:MAG: hypothetical protein A2133_02320 [Actinobacteria bacterium RBG_16_64_13]|nr:MAG: hypothetical protein A2133_02320 [Actinobacteria bacterium RBG_16_64_13]